MEGYSFSLSQVKDRVKAMILKDISRFSDLGACRHVSDLTEVPQQFDLASPETPVSGR